MHFRLCIALSIPLALAGCIRYTVIEPVPHLAETAQASAARSSRISTAVDQVATTNGFVRDTPTRQRPLAVNMQARYFNRSDAEIVVATGNYQERRFAVFVSPGDPRAIASVLVAGKEPSLDVPVISHRIIETLRAQNKDLRFESITRVKYSGEF